MSIEIPVRARLFVGAVVASSCGFLFGGSYYVSTNGLHEVDGVVWGTYETDDGAAHDAFTDLQQAIDANGKREGTIWIEDGFVCDTGVTDKGSRIKTPYIGGNDKLIIRSRSGCWETGAEIRGAYHSAEEPCGAGSVRCVFVDCGAKFIGLRFTGGSTTGNGGGISGVTYGTTLENCLVENCIAQGSGGGVFQSGSRNWNDSMSTRMVNCVIRNNRTVNGNGGGAYSVHMISCQVYGNTSAGTSWSSGCGGGMAYGVAAQANYNIILSNCVFFANSATNPGQVQHASRQAGCGGGLFLSNLNGEITACVFSNNTATAWGGGAYCSAAVKSYNTVFRDNSAIGQAGGGIYGGVHFGCLVTGNTAAFASGVFSSYTAGLHARLINCTVTGNTTTGTKAPYEAGYLALTNSVVWSEKAGAIPVVDNLKGSASSCYPTATEGENGNTARSPKLRTEHGKEFAATARLCKGTGIEFAWMTDPGDVRVKDWYGDPRILGDGPDMGWVSVCKLGLMLIYR